ncbi:serine/threonine protein phosphatase [Streptomyces sp. NPDC006692]|uniref:serine/threonine protein phosphatase n=1 Tax=Streptomyces sp. NPDC006692 TaxID=3364758 RepID=UPI0036AD16A4
MLALAVAAAAGMFYVSSQRGDADAADGRKTSTTMPTPSATPSRVPDGYRVVRDQQLGVSFPIPDDWTPKTGSGGAVTYTDPSGLAGITIGMVNPAGSHPIEHFTDIETNTKANYATYRRLRMQKTTFKDKPAAVWEFTFHGRARAFHAIDLGYGTAGGREYDIYLSAPEAQWDMYRPVFDAVQNGFTD